jgi:formate hydrogenlyase subunit 6/NADH:ubiquinone oxidoreductase subunit I
MTRPGKMLQQVLGAAMKRPVTVRYPAVKVLMPDKFRGKIQFDSSKCIGCRLCMRDCPSNAITIRKVGDKQFQADMDLGRCIYCAQCVDTCPKKALRSTGEFELAQLQRGRLQITYERQPGPAAPAPASAPAAPAAAAPAAPAAANPDTASPAPAHKTEDNARPEGETPDRTAGR